MGIADQLASTEYVVGEGALDLDENLTVKTGMGASMPSTSCLGHTGTRGRRVKEDIGINHRPPIEHAA
jgi:hypothetical protein